MSSIIKAVVLGIVVITAFVIMHQYKDTLTTTMPADDDFTISGWGLPSFLKPGSKPMCCKHTAHPRNAAPFTYWCYDPNCWNAKHNCQDDLSICDTKDSRKRC